MNQNPFDIISPALDSSSRLAMDNDKQTCMDPTMDPYN